MANNLEIFRGDTKQYTLNFKDAVGVAIDITDWTVFFTVKKERSDLGNNKSKHYGGRSGDA